jgi:hypothetical protein
MFAFRLIAGDFTLTLGTQPTTLTNPNPHLLRNLVMRVKLCCQLIMQQRYRATKKNIAEHPAPISPTKTPLVAYKYSGKCPP